MHEPTALNLSALEQAIDRLSEGLDRYRQASSDLLLRDGLIKRFRECHEVSYKMLKRYLSMTSASPDDYADMAFQDLIRSGNESGLLKSDWPRWRLFRETREKASHAHDDRVAEEVVTVIPEFLVEVDVLRDRLRQRLGR